MIKFAMLFCYNSEDYMRKISIFHPFLFAIYPILFLYSYNIDETPLIQIWRPVSIIILFTAILWLILIMIFKEKEKTGLIVSLFLFLFFSSVHIHRFLYFCIKIDEIYLFIAILVIFIFLSYACIKTKKNSLILTGY